MADQTPKYPEGTELHYPDGSLYVYLQLAEDIGPGTYVEVNASSRVMKFKGGLRFPPGIVQETAPKDWFSFIMVREPRPKKANPSGGIIS